MHCCRMQRDLLTTVQLWLSALRNTDPLEFLSLTLTGPAGRYWCWCWAPDRPGLASHDTIHGIDEVRDGCGRFFCSHVTYGKGPLPFIKVAKKQKRNLMLYFSPVLLFNKAMFLSSKRPKHELVMAPYNPERLGGEDKMSLGGGTGSADKDRRPWLSHGSFLATLQRPLWGWPALPLAPFEEGSPRPAWNQNGMIEFLLFT